MQKKKKVFKNSCHLLRLLFHFHKLEKTNLPYLVIRILNYPCAAHPWMPALFQEKHKNSTHKQRVRVSHICIVSIYINMQHVNTPSQFNNKMYAL